MEIRFSLTPEDFWHYYLYVYLHYLRKTLLLLLLVYTALIVGVFQIVYPHGDILPRLVLFIVVLVIPPLVVVLTIRRRSSRGAGWGGEHVISLTPVGYRQRTDRSEGIQKWRAVKDITHDKHSLYFILDALGPSRVIMGVIIPRRAFAAPQDAEMFLSQARQYWMNERQLFRR